MKVKKFFASNNQEVLMKVKSELGSDAVILHQRKVKPKGLFGIFRKSIIEVVAAKEEGIVHKEEHVSNNTEDLIRSLQQKVEEKKKEDLPNTAITQDVNEIKTMLNMVMHKVNQQSLPQLVQGIQNKEITRLFEVLKEQEVEDGLIEEIMQQFIKIQSEDNYGENFIKTEIHKVIKKYIGSDGNKKECKILFFVGPTGVGKTTTIAKLAAQFSLNEGKSIGLISADTYRIAAVEQLRTYSEILNIPLEVIYNITDIHYAINQLKDKDIIMIDTAGRSHKNKKQVEELKNLLEEIEEKETFLVMSCTSKNSDMKEIVKAYNFIEKYNIIFTKIDEATTFGAILNVAKETNKPISYITTGQSVPDDIEEMNAEKIASLLTKEVLQ
ncbi:MAG: flagellar biosynthesis protein FlhF [Clostridiaceae bacterium]|nr:flagellar biosynthesis protein FlhF [Clostridiaceae bacterium]